MPGGPAAGPAAGPPDVPGACPDQPGWPSVGVMNLPERPRLARGAVGPLDVVLAPADLGLRVGQPVRAAGGHLGAWIRLRDPVRTVRIARPLIPVALPYPDVVETRELGCLPRAPAVSCQLDIGIGLLVGIGGPSGHIARRIDHGVAVRLEDQDGAAVPVRA